MMFGLGFAELLRLLEAKAYLKHLDEYFVVINEIEKAGMLK